MDGSGRQKRSPSASERPSGGNASESSPFDDPKLTVPVYIRLDKGLVIRLSERIYQENKKRKLGRITRSDFIRWCIEQVLDGNVTVTEREDGPDETAVDEKAADDSEGGNRGG